MLRADELAKFRLSIQQNDPFTRGVCTYICTVETFRFPVSPVCIYHHAPFMSDELRNHFDAQIESEWERALTDTSTSRIHFSRSRYTQHG